MILAPGGHLYSYLYIILVHENEEIWSFFSTRRVSRLGYQKRLKWEKKGYVLVIGILEKGG